LLAAKKRLLSGQLGLTAALTASTVTAGVKQIIFFFAFFFSVFELGGIAKHLMTSPSGNSEFCFLSTLNVSRGELWDQSLST